MRFRPCVAYSYDKYEFFSCLFAFLCAFVFALLVVCLARRASRQRDVGAGACISRGGVTSPTPSRRAGTPKSGSLTAGQVLNIQIPASVYKSIVFGATTTSLNGIQIGVGGGLRGGRFTSPALCKRILITYLN